MTDNGNTTIYPYQIKGLRLQSQTENHGDKKRPVSMEEEDVYHISYYFYIFLNKKHFKNNDAPACPMNEFVPSRSKCQGGAHPLSLSSPACPMTRTTDNTYNKKEEEQALESLAQWLVARFPLPNILGLIFSVYTCHPCDVLLVY
jgi:hypothetical protein